MALDGLYVPAGRHDDQVDAVGLVGQLLDNMVPLAKPGPQKPPRDPWERPNDKGPDWKTV